MSSSSFDPDERLSLEQDVLVPLSQTKKLFVYETKDFWCQIKTAGYILSLFFKFPLLNI